MTGHLKRTTTDISERVKFLNCVVLRGYRTPRELIASMQDALNSGRNVAFVPTNKTMRHFFNTEGFRREMLKVADGLKNWEELIAADFYANRHVFAVGPAQRISIEKDKVSGLDNV